MKKIAALFAILIATSLLLAGCQTSQPQSAPAPQQQTPRQQASVSAPATILAPPTKTDKTIVYMVKINDNGATPGGIKIGCNDSLITKEVTVPYTYNPQSPGERINAAFIALGNMTEDQFTAEGLENSVAKSMFTLPNVEKVNDTYLIHLEGKFTFSGTCDVPRQKGQIEQMVVHAAGAEKAQIILNDDSAAWEKAFSSKE